MPNASAIGGKAARLGLIPPRDEAADWRGQGVIEAHEECWRKAASTTTRLVDAEPGVGLGAFINKNEIYNY